MKNKGRWLATWMVALTLLACVSRSKTTLRASARGPCTTSSQVVKVDGDLTAHVFYPSKETCGDGIAAPYPGVAFAHGFTMFGVVNGAKENLGHGEHLASWGYVVVIPELPDDFDTRYAAMERILSYLETASATKGSALEHRVDTERLAAAGHSLGGATALALARRDARIRAVVALDPVYHTGGPGGGEALWDPKTAGPEIRVPAGILGAPAASCNADADYARIYPRIGATHKAAYMLVDGSHCDFNDPGGALCGVICGPADPARAELAQTYMTAWLNYYLYLDTASYDVLYGEQAQADVDDGLIQRQQDTAPRGLAADAEQDIHLAWLPYEHPIVDGYDLYRRAAGEPDAQTPLVQLGRTHAYTDTDVVPGQVYSYTVRSRDAAGNLHQAAAEVTARVRERDTPARLLYLALIVR